MGAVATCQRVPDGRGENSPALQPVSQNSQSWFGREGRRLAGSLEAWPKAKSLQIVKVVMDKSN